ncbi:MAG TPA: carbohydrate kinase family protein [Gammaproteobacteria bacterium]|nr:carbohydrate kinase family protein [Gammaproteobacteria bacterium]
MDALITGSIAYDTIMVYPGRFKDDILPDKVHMLNVSFLVPELRRNFGGCAGNIAYSLALLDADAAPMATVGLDFGTYQEWLRQNRIPIDHIRKLSEHYTAQAYITTDIDDNQITAFHPGAMNESHQNVVPSNSGIRLGTVSPDGRDGMLQHARQFAEAGVPFMFDPGQGMPMFDGKDLLAFVNQAEWLTLNSYEAELMQSKTGLTLDKLADQVAALIVTHGGEGSVIYTGGKEIKIDVVKPEAVRDPTGCGDAYRAGLIYGLLNDMDWETTGRIAALLGAIKVAQAGTQNHRFTREQFEARFAEVFKYSLT